MSSTVSRRIPEVLRSGQMAFQDFYRNEHDQRVYLAVLVPILAESEASPPLGVLVLRIDPETYLYPLLQRWPTPSPTAETLLVRREGNEVVFLNELRFQENSALTRRAPLDQEALPAARAALGQEGVMEGLDYRGVPVVAALRAIPNSPWFLIARMDTAEVYAPLREQLKLVGVLIGALLFGAGAGTAMLWRHQRVRFYRERYEAAEALVASEVRYRRLFEAARDGILILDAETGMIVDVNPFLIEILGFSREEFLGKKVWELGAFKDIVANQDSFAELQRKEYIRYEDMALEGHDGKRHEVEFISNVYLVNHQKVIQCNIRDITARKLAEQALRQQTEDLRTRNAELMRINRASVGRELRMVELKQQINELCRQLGQPPRHPLDFLGAKPQTPTAAEAVGPEGASRTDADLSEVRFSKASQTNAPRGAPRRAAE
jgi:PAS domain S-box-containing protein